MVYIASQTGVRHVHGEDAVLVGSNVYTETQETAAVPESGFICVADGVGGNPGGAQASQFVLGSLANTSPSAEDLRETLINVNTSLIQEAMATADAAFMATTLTGIYIHDGGNYLMHVGNTRAYVKQGKYLKQITSDQTAYNLLRMSGRLEAAEACNRNEITNCFGGGDPSLLSRLYVSKIPAFSMMLLTSDGVHEYVSIDDLEEIIFGEGDYDDKCNLILTRAYDAGSTDDMTLVLIVPPET